MTITSRLPSALALAAALSMTATPVAAVEMPVHTGTASIPEATEAAPAKDTADRHRWHRYRRNRVDAGDVIAGVLVLGGIAAIASAASKNNRDRDDRYRDRDYRYRDRDYQHRERRGDSRYDGSSGIDNAVNMCVSSIERDVRVESVDEVNRTGEGWRVAGRLYDGNGFTCRIGGDGRIDNIDYGRRSTAYSAPETDDEDNQWDDERYLSARADTGASVPGAPVERQPAYPGGPIDDDIDGSLD